MGTVGAAIVAVARQPPEKRRREFARAGVFGVALGLAGVGVLAAAGSEIDPPAWTARLPWAAVITAGAAGLCALLALAGRRWFVALLSFVLNPAALIYMVLSTGALC